MSRKWDALEAGREVARNTIKKLKTPPDFFLLFSTIHYEKHGGFQEFLNGVCDILPEATLAASQDIKAAIISLIVIVILITIGGIIGHIGEEIKKLGS